MGNLFTRHEEPNEFQYGLITNFLKDLGQGSFGEVKLVTLQSRKYEQYAMKEIFDVTGPEEIAEA